MIKMILNFLEQHSVSMAVIISLIVGLFKFWQYIDIKRSESKQRRFENYHKLIERFTAPLEGHDHPFLDVQKAAVFELRNYPEYKKLTKDILENWIKRDTKLTDWMKDTLKELSKK
jgi:hypothetical protein